MQIFGSKCTNLRDAIILVTTPLVTELWKRTRARLALTSLLAEQIAGRIRMLDCRTDLAWVAEGNSDASVMLNNKPWDTSAGVLIAREAGVRVLDVDGTQHNFNSRGTVAVAGPLANGLIDLIAQAGIADPKDPTESQVSHCPRTPPDLHKRLGQCAQSGVPGVPASSVRQPLPKPAERPCVAAKERLKHRGHLDWQGSQSGSHPSQFRTVRNGPTVRLPRLE